MQRQAIAGGRGVVGGRAGEIGIDCLLVVATVGRETDRAFGQTVEIVIGWRNRSADVVAKQRGCFHAADRIIGIRMAGAVAPRAGRGYKIVDQGRLREALILVVGIDRAALV